MNVQTASSAMIDLAAIKSRQRIAWGSGDYSVIGTTLQIVGETLCEAVDLRGNQHVLDVAARQWQRHARGGPPVRRSRIDRLCRLAARTRPRACQSRALGGHFRGSRCGRSPFAEASFDIVLSTFGVMFAPNQERAASELIRVCRPGGKIGLANWTPESFVGMMFKIIGKYIPPPPGLKSPMLWGNRAHLEALFGSRATIVAESKNFVFRYKSPKHWFEVFRSYGALLKAFEEIDDQQARAALEADLYALLNDFNIAMDGTLVVPSEYLEVVIIKRR